MHTAKHAFFRYPHSPHLELRVSTGVSDCYQLHSHPEFSFGLIDDGSAVCQVREKRTAISKGMAIMLEPHLPHACNPTPGRVWAYRMLYVHADWLVQQLDAVDTSRLVFAQHCLRDEVTFQTLHSIMGTLQRADSKADTLHSDELLLTLAAQHLQVPTGAPQPEPAAMRKARDWIHAHASQAISLADLSAHCGVSGYRLIRQFKQVYGLPPYAYQLDLRIQTAQQLLKSGMQLSQIALDLGFADQAHFQRHFRQRSATTPATYAALVK